MVNIGRSRVRLRAPTAPSPSRSGQTETGQLAVVHDLAHTSKSAGADLERTQV